MIPSASPAVCRKNGRARLIEFSNLKIDCASFDRLDLYTELRLGKKLMGSLGFTTSPFRFEPAPVFSNVKKVWKRTRYKIPESLQIMQGDTEEVIAAKRRKIHAIKNQQKDGLQAQKQVPILPACSRTSPMQKQCFQQLL